ncbi:MAG: hypothetical protein CMK56_07810 [Proteobacteria bacterium]|nr:hypothetical protein [Pseudomonadota bacterium]
MDRKLDAKLKISKVPQTSDFLVASFYKFSTFQNLSEYRLALVRICSDANMLGTIILADEGINGTISGTDKNVSKVLQFLWETEALIDMRPKFAFAKTAIFKSMRVRIRDEIVALKKDDLNPSQETGKFIQPEKWNDIISDPNTVVIDTRNFYEHSLGTFKGSIKAETQYFRQFPHWVQNNLKILKNKRIAMFCTGGVRCEKASSFLLQNGYEDVVQLDGGILKYLEKIKEKSSLWQGECFVFDNRVTVNHLLDKGDYYLDPLNRIPQKNIKSDD